jgi:predicted nucleic acid-binding protein
LLRAAANARYELVASRKLLEELEEVLLRPKFRKYLSEDEVHEFVRGVSDVAELAADPPFEPGLTHDPDDD